MHISFAMLILIIFAALFIGALAGSYVVAVCSIETAKRKEQDHREKLEKAQVDSYYEGFDDGKKHREYHAKTWPVPEGTLKAIRMYREEHGLPPLGRSELPKS